MRRTKALPGYWFDRTGGVYKFNGHYQSGKSTPQKGVTFSLSNAWGGTGRDIDISHEGTAYHVLTCIDPPGGTSKEMSVSDANKEWFNFSGEYLCHFYAQIPATWDPSTLTGTTFEGMEYSGGRTNPRTIYAQDDANGDKLYSTSDAFYGKNLWVEGGSRSILLPCYAGGYSHGEIEGYIGAPGYTNTEGLWVSNRFDLTPYTDNAPFPGIVELGDPGEENAVYVHIKYTRPLTTGSGYYVDLAEDDFDLLKVWYDNYIVTPLTDPLRWGVDVDIHITGNDGVKYTNFPAVGVYARTLNAGGWTDYNTENGSNIASGTYWYGQGGTATLTYPTA